MKAMAGWLTFLLFLTAMMLPRGATAQLGFGIRGGVNFGSLDDIETGSLSQTFDHRTGFHVGAFIDLGLGSVAVRVGGNYLSLGKVFEGASFLSQDDFNLTYLSVPVDVRLRFPLVYLFAGPEVFYHIPSEGIPADFEDALQSLVMNGGVGAGAQFGPLLAELRYAFGLSGLIDTDFQSGGVSVTTGQSQKANTIRASVGVTF